MTAHADIKALLDCLLPPPTEESDSPLLQPYFTTCQRATQVLGMTVLIDSGTKLDRCLYLKNVTKQRLNDISALVVRARSAGVFVSNDPIPSLIAMNRGRTLYSDVPPSPAVDEMAKTIADLSKIVEDEQTGRVSFERSPKPQVSTLEISFDGIDGLPSDVFDADSLKRQQALNKLSLLDFSKRRARVLFVVEEDSSRGARVNVLIGWRKIRDATGYRLKIRDVFSGKTTERDISSGDVEVIAPDTVEFYRTVIAPVLGDRAREKDVAVHVIKDVPRNALFSYSVTPYQRVSSSKNDLFRVSLNRLTMTSTQLDELVSHIESLGVSPDAMTPYPFISEYLYGTRRFGWVLAGINLLSSFERGEDVSTVRSYSYLGASMTGIRSIIEAGLFYVPSDVTEFQGRLDTSLSRFGLTNTLAEVLDKCGVLLFFDEREGFDVASSTLSREAALRETSVVAAILSAIDPETATVLPEDIYSNVITSQPTAHVSKTIVPLQVSLSTSSTIRLDTSTDEIDLLSFEGVSRLLDVVVDASRSAR